MPVRRLISHSGHLRGRRRCDQARRRRRIGERVTHQRGDRGLERRCREPPAIEIGLAAPGDQPVRDVVAMPPTAAHRMGRCQLVARLVEELSCQRRRRGCSFPALGARGVVGELRLDSLPDVAPDDRRVLAVIGVRLVPDLTDIDRVRSSIGQSDCGLSQ